MIFALIGSVAFSTAQRRNTVANAITSALTGKQRWNGAVEVNENYNPGIRIAATNGRRFEFRFLTEADADTVWTAAINAMTTTPPAPGSWIAQHSCNHDTVGVPCVEKRRQDYT